MTRELKDAEDYPRFCPSCGNRRLLQREKVAGPIFVSFSGEKQTEVLTGEWTTVPTCTRCGLDFQSIPDPATALTRRLEGLSDNELAMVLKLFYPNFHNLVSMVAAKVGKSIGHVQRVLDGERKSVEIDRHLVSEFRARLLATGTAKLL